MRIVTAPASKSLGIRAAVCDFLGGSKGKVLNYPDCDDAVFAKRALQSITNAKGAVTVDCGESALCHRMLSPICGVLGIDATFKQKGSLSSRPSGIDAECIKKLSSGKRIVGGVANVDASVTSQFLSGLLLALPLAEKDSHLIVENLVSRPYVDMTIALMKLYGVNIEKNSEGFLIKAGQKYKPVTYTVEGDFAGAAFILVAGVIVGNVTVLGLDYKNSLQPEKKIVDILKNVGAEVYIEKDRVQVKRNTLRAFEFDASDNPDLVPPLCALAVYCKGTSTISGTGRLKHKESDRALALCEEFSELGADIKLLDDRIVVSGGKLKRAEVNSHGDHRIAMAVSTAGLGIKGGIVLRDKDCVSKSYPNFFADLEAVSHE